MESQRFEQVLTSRIRQAVQFCKTEHSLNVNTDKKMESDERMVMEHCLVKNYLVPHGMDYFGKRDLIYIDMQGDKDVARMDSRVLVT